MAKKIKTTLGGDRLGSGNRQKVYLHNYGRSNHNLSCTRITSMAPGVLYPMYTQIGLPGDTFDFNLSAFVRTLPTEGPLFGAFKLQVDVFSADMRLYQAILHNNTTEIGFNMDQVLMPKMMINTYAENKSKVGAFNKSSLMYYLGMAGAGRSTSADGNVSRKINALPMLAYYDIFKNYYANKQEDLAYVITSGEVTTTTSLTSTITSIESNGNGIIVNGSRSFLIEPTIQIGEIASIKGTNLVVNGELNFKLFENITKVYISVSDKTYINIDNYVFAAINQTSNLVNLECIEILGNNNPQREAIFEPETKTYTETTGEGTIRLQEFELKNIDEMRKRLLTQWDLGSEVVIDENETLLPYSEVVGTRQQYVDKGETAELENLSKNCDPMQGLVVKCYQSDWFNNWLDSDYMAQIAANSQVNVTGGSFSIDALNFAKKLYDHYNRIAVTGGSYDDWMKAAYGMVRYGKSEKPIYHGGMSSEVIFDEVVSSVATADQPLGSLGGRGALKGRNGGHVIVKCNEECILMIMVSLTPRISYSQGNAWYLTELDSINDLHQPDFDRIGFQDLMTEQLAWFDTQINPQTGDITRTSVGKQPAWMQYQTDVDKVYADFAAEEGKGFMVLQRLYDQDETSGGVADVTTYIDPTKYNYAFAVNDLTAQNFWTFLNVQVQARRLMSAKQMPNV